MPASSSYQLLVAGEVFEAWETLRRADRLLIADTFEFLADYPYTAGDYVEIKEDGIAANVLLKGHFLLTFRADHAARELRILRVERA